MLTKNSPEQLARRRAMHSQLTSFLVIISYYLYDNLVAMEYLLFIISYYLYGN